MSKREEEAAEIAREVYAALADVTAKYRLPFVFAASVNGGLFTLSNMNKQGQEAMLSDAVVAETQRPAAEGTVYQQ